jgi:enoyl-CoA hydratase
MKIKKYANIEFEIEDSIAIITLNRPKSLNALSMDLIDELESILMEIEANKDIHVFIITGSNRTDGRPNFCAGADIKNREMNSSPSGEPLLHTIDALREFSAELVLQHQSRYNHVFTYLENMSTPSIAVVDGICTTGGLELILSCDLRIVGEAVEISDWHTKNLQVIGGAGATTRLPKLINASKAKEILWTGKIVRTNEAVDIGLANMQFSSKKLLEESKIIAKNIASMSPYAISASKVVVNKASEQSTQESIRFAQVWSALIAAQKEANNADLPKNPLEK